MNPIFLEDEEIKPIYSFDSELINKNIALYKMEEHKNSDQLLQEVLIFQFQDDNEKIYAPEAIIDNMFASRDFTEFYLQQDIALSKHIQQASRKTRNFLYILIAIIVASLFFRINTIIFFPIIILFLLLQFVYELKKVKEILYKPVAQKMIDLKTKEMAKENLENIIKYLNNSNIISKKNRRRYLIVFGRILKQIEIINEKN